MNTFYCLLSSFVLFAFIIYCMKHVCAKNCNEAPRDDKEEPIYCRWRDGKWDGEYRNKEGEITTLELVFLNYLLCWDLSLPFYNPDGNIWSPIIDVFGV